MVEGTLKLTPPDDQTRPFELRILGALEARTNERPLALGPRKQRALLARLVISANQVVSRDLLIEDLWAGEPPPGAATTLRSHISRLRSALEGADDAPTIDARPPGYVLKLSADQLDASRFDRLARRGREALARGAADVAADRLAEALSLWRGPALDDVADEPFARAEAARLDELRLRAFEDRIDADLELGRHRDVVAELERLVEEHPLRERLWRQLMIALYRCDRQAEALSAYRRIRGLLAGDLGLEPSAGLKELEQAILRHDLRPARGPKTPHNLPAQLTSFVGRERELARLERLLGDFRLVTLTGVGGVGKTRLALEAAYGALPSFCDGVWFIELAGVSDSALVPQAVAAALPMERKADRSASQDLREYLGSPQLLLVIDNCEHLGEACAELASELLRACPALRILATSREPLGIEGERCELVSPLPFPAADANGADVTKVESVRLFLDRALAVRPELELTPAALAAVATTARELEGLPLAIELAASRARALTLEEIASRLDDRLRFLRSSDPTSSDRHQTLAATLDWSYQLLGEDERAVLRGLSAFAGGFTLDAVAQVCRAGDEESALDVVTRLVAASLVVAEDDRGAMRYRLLETVRQYAAARLEEAGEREEVRRRHADHYLALAEQLRQHEPPKWYELLDAEHDNLHAALSWAHETGDAEVELRLAISPVPGWTLRRGYVDEAKRSLERALAGDAYLPLERAKAHAQLGRVHVRLGDYAQARELLTEALDEFRVLGHADGIGHVLLSLSTVAALDAELGRATELAQEAARLARDRCDSNLAMWASIDLARLALGRDDTEQARTLLHDALAAEQRKDAQAAEHRRGTLSHGLLSLTELAFLAVYEGDDAGALSLFQKSITLLQQLRIFVFLPDCLLGLAIVAAAQGREGRAARLLGAAHGLRDVFGPPSRTQPTAWQRDRAERALTSVRERLGEERFATAWAEGEALSIEQASACALDLEDTGCDRSIAPQRASTVDA
jgi:predicted ATPase/DNA-binding SARP family transcriptional activator